MMAVLPSRRTLLLGFSLLTVCLYAQQIATQEVETNQRWKHSVALSGVRDAFIENRGQFDPQVLFQLPTTHGAIWVCRDSLIFDVVSLKRTNTPRHNIAQRYVGASESAVTVSARQPREGIFSYFRGSDPRHWQTGVRRFSEVLLENMWPGITVRLYVPRSGELEQEFIVKPGADPHSIRIGFDGVDSIRLDHSGTLVIRTLYGELRESLPSIFQEQHSGRREVAGGFRLMGNNVYTFGLGSFDRKTTLTIDPTLSYGTYLGGSKEVRMIGFKT